MSDAEPTWSLKDHLQEGRSVVAATAQVSRANIPQPLCHHFFQADPVDPMKVSVEATYAPLTPPFEALGLAFLSDRSEE
jgi:hypothetical protein